MRRCQSEKTGARASNFFSKTLPRVTWRSASLLMGCLLMGMCSGCTTSESGRRVLACRTPWTSPDKSAVSKSERQAHLVSTLQNRDVSSDRMNQSAERSVEGKETSPRILHSIVRQVNGVEETAYDPSEKNDQDPPAPTPFGTETPSGITQPGSFTESVSALTLADLENRALQNNPTLSQAQAAVTGQQGIYVQAGLYPNPQIGYLNSTSKPSVKQSNGLFYSQEFVTANKLGLAQLAASEELRRYQWDHEAQRMRVMNDLKIRYYEVLGAQEAVAVYRQLIQVSEKSLSVAESLLASEGTRTDYLQAKVQLETVRLNLEEAELRYVAAWEQLATMIGDSGMQPVPLVGELSGNLPSLDLETSWQRLLSQSPQLRSAESELGHGWATYREAQALAVPNITLQTVADYDRATEAATLSTLVALPLPIFNRNQGNIDKAAADIRADQDDICRIQLVLRDLLADSFRRYQTSLRQTQRLKESILPSAEENLSLCQQLFSKGQTAFAPVLAAQQSYFKSKVAYVEALTELHKVVTEIEGLQLTGGLNPAAVGSALQNQPAGGTQRQRALLNELQDNNSKQLLPAAQIGR